MCDTAGIVAFLQHCWPNVIEFISSHPAFHPGATLHIVHALAGAGAVIREGSGVGSAVGDLVVDVLWP